MKRRETLQEWMNKIRKEGLPNNKLHRDMFIEVIENIEKRIKQDNSWESIQEYIKDNRIRFEGEQTMVGPFICQKIFTQIWAKIYSINVKYDKSLRLLKND